MPGQQVEAIATCDGTLEKPTSGPRQRVHISLASRVQNEMTSFGKRRTLSQKSTTLLSAVMGGWSRKYMGDRSRTSANTRGSF